MVVQDPEGQLYQQLGKLIWDGIPYAYKDSDDKLQALVKALEDNPPEPFNNEGVLPSRKKPLDTISVDGPARKYGGVGNPDKVHKSGGAVSENSMRDKPWESLWWMFNGHQYRVTKAIMVPYTVDNENGSGTTTRHFLIGYMGVDSNG